MPEADDTDGLLKIGLSSQAGWFGFKYLAHSNCSLLENSLWIGNDQARALESPEKS